MTKDNATPRPWKNTGRDIESESGIIGSCYGESDAEESANAKLIVKAVNCHDELVEALKYALEMAQQGAIPNDDDSWYKEAKQALKKASE